MLQLPENLEDEYENDVNMTDHDLEEQDSLMDQESDSDDFYLDEAMDIEPDSDFGDETLTFGPSDQPHTTKSSESSSDSESPPDLIQTSRAVKMALVAPTKEMTPASTASSERKKVSSAIHEGLSLVKNTPQSRGLFKYFKECSREQYLVDVARETEKSREIVDQQAYAMEEANQIKKVNLQQRARVRKQKSRMLKKSSEIQLGLRSPGGTKRRVCPLTLLPYIQIKITKGH